MKIRKYIFFGPVIGWLGFDKRQVQRVACGYKIDEQNHAGELETDYRLWWCIFGFTGLFPLPRTAAYLRRCAKLNR